MPRLNVKVVPGASRDRVAGLYGDGIKVQVAAPPEDGKANKAVVRVLSDFLGLRIDQIEIDRGQTQPRKVVRLTGISQAELDQKLSDLT